MRARCASLFRRLVFQTPCDTTTEPHTDYLAASLHWRTARRLCNPRRGKSVDSFHSKDPCKRRFQREQRRRFSARMSDTNLRWKIPQLRLAQQKLRLWRRIGLSSRREELWLHSLERSLWQAILGREP